MKIFVYFVTNFTAYFIKSLYIIFANSQSDPL